MVANHSTAPRNPQGTQETTAPAGAPMPHAEYIQQVCARALDLERAGLDGDQALREATREVTSWRHPQPDQDAAASQAERSLSTTTADALTTLLVELPQRVEQRLAADEDTRELYERAEQLLMSLEWLDRGTSILSTVDPTKQRAVRRCYETYDQGLVALGTLVELEALAAHPTLAAELIRRLHRALERALLGPQPVEEQPAR